MPFCKITKENNQPYHQLSCEITASGHQPVVVKTARAMNFTKELEENISSARELEKYPVAQKAGGARRDLQVLVAGQRKPSQGEQIPRLPLASRWRNHLIKNTISELLRNARGSGGAGGHKQ